MTAIISPTRILLVKDPSRLNALYKLPGGTIEPSDAGVVAAAVREALEETGVVLGDAEVELVAQERRDGRTYYPYFCIAQVSEEKLDSHKKIGDEDGRRIEVAAFDRTEAPTMLDLLERHRHFIRTIEEVSATLSS